ncbi:MAG TPA: HAD hydrolase family protein [Bacteroidales bacterium]|nr:HAD hydrolase family protein [Bacteroidales bacterium]
MDNNLRGLNFKLLLKNAGALFFDIDGVLSSSQVNISERGVLTRTTSVKDGYVLKYALKKGIIICVISGGIDESVKIRFESLGIKDVIIGCNNKLDEFERLVRKYNLNYKNVLYMGDDIPDYQVMKKVGIPCCPIDAADEIKEISLYISSKKGGEGCVRDITEQVLRAKGVWMDYDAFEL